MKRIMPSLLVIGLACSLLGAGAISYFIDVETSAGNVIQSGTLDLSFDVTKLTVKLHPKSAIDFTIPWNLWGGDGSSIRWWLSGEERAKLASSDDDRYTTGLWLSGYNWVVFEFTFPPIPEYAMVNLTKINFEWARENGITGARLRVWDGSNWSSYYELTPLPDHDTDRTDTLDVSNFIDTAAEVNALKLQFQAKGIAHTSHDLVELEVTYTVPAGKPLIALEELRPAEPQSVIITVTNNGSLAGKLGLHFKNLTGSNVGSKGLRELRDEHESGKYVPEVVSPEDVDNPQAFIWTKIFYKGSLVAEGWLKLIACSELELGVLMGGATENVELIFNLDPYDQTGNVYLKDRCEFDIELTLEQVP